MKIVHLLKGWICPSILWRFISIKAVNRLRTCGRLMYRFSTFNDELVLSLPVALTQMVRPYKAMDIIAICDWTPLSVLHYYISRMPSFSYSLAPLTLIIPSHPSPVLLQDLRLYSMGWRHQPPAPHLTITLFSF